MDFFVSITQKILKTLIHIFLTSVYFFVVTYMQVASGEITTKVGNQNTKILVQPTEKANLASLISYLVSSGSAPNDTFGCEAKDCLVFDR